MSTPATFFTFQQGSDAHSLPPSDVESIRYGRFRAFSTKRSLQNLFSAFTGDGADEPDSSAVYAGYASYGSISLARGVEVAGDDEGDDEIDERWWGDRIFLSPSRSRVRYMMEKWWRRWAYLIILPAAISVLWCAVPFPTYPLDSAERDSVAVHDISTRSRTAVEVTGVSSIWDQITAAFGNLYDFSLLWDIITAWFDTLRNYIPELPDNPEEPDIGGPGHGRSEVALNFYFFLYLYYGFYNLVGLLWITKIFNMYSLNWWPSFLGFPASFTLFNLLPLWVGLLMYHFLPHPIITANLTWIFLTFATMCCPLIVTFIVLVFQRRHNHLGRGTYLSETQLLFSTNSRRNSFSSHRPRAPVRFRWPQTFSLPRSYKRFLWFSLSLFLTLTAFVLGEAYAELYLRTLPHTSLETVIYVWSWVLTIHILDITTGWVLGAKVGSYPLGVVFKMFFNLTYQTYVRALYARLRAPSQFLYLQLLSSSIVILWNPLTMTRPFHRLLQLLYLNGQSYSEWRKTVGRSFWVRGLAENVSMLAWLGWVLVLHYGPNRKVYPYFSFNKAENHDGYTFNLTFWASLATWAAEMTAGWVVRRVFRWGFGFRVTEEAKRDMAMFPELAPALLCVALHVLQNMLFSIVRLRFY